MEKGDSSIAKVQPNSVRLKNHASTSALVEYIASSRAINKVIFRTMIIVAQLSRFFLTRDHHRNDLPFRAKSYHASDYGLEQAKIITIPRNLFSRLSRTLNSSEVLRFNRKLLKSNAIVIFLLYLASVFKSNPSRLVSFSKTTEDSASPASPSSAATSSTTTSPTTTTSTTSSTMADEFRFDDEDLEMDVSLDVPPTPEAESGIDRRVRQVQRQDVEVADAHTTTARGNGNLVEARQHEVMCDQVRHAFASSSIGHVARRSHSAHGAIGGIEAGLPRASSTPRPSGNVTPVAPPQMADAQTGSAELVVEESEGAEAPVTPSPNANPSGAALELAEIGVEAPPQISPQADAGADLVAPSSAAPELGVLSAAPEAEAASKLSPEEAKARKHAAVKERCRVHAQGRRRRKRQRQAQAKAEAAAQVTPLSVIKSVVVAVPREETPPASRPPPTFAARDVRLLDAAAGDWRNSPASTSGGAAPAAPLKRKASRPAAPASPPSAPRPPPNPAPRHSAPTPKGKGQGKGRRGMREGELEGRKAAEELEAKDPGRADRIRRRWSDAAAAKANARSQEMPPSAPAPSHARQPVVAPSAASPVLRAPPPPPPPSSAPFVFSARPAPPLPGPSRPSRGAARGGRAPRFAPPTMRIIVPPLDLPPLEPIPDEPAENPPLSREETQRIVESLVLQNEQLRESQRRNEELMRRLRRD